MVGQAELGEEASGQGNPSEVQAKAAPQFQVEHGQGDGEALAVVDDLGEVAVRFIRKVVAGAVEAVFGEEVAVEGGEGGGRGGAVGGVEGGLEVGGHALDFGEVGGGIEVGVVEAGQEECGLR